jgi:general stress protein 13
MTKYRKGKIIRGTVTGIESYGVFVSCDEYYSGLIHISEISHGFVKNVSDYVNVGDVINVEVLDIDEELSQLKLSIKNIDYKKNNISKRKKIIETNLGFSTLAYHLPNWIDESLQKIKNTSNSIDK